VKVNGLLPVEQSLAEASYSSSRLATTKKLYIDFIAARVDDKKAAAAALAIYTPQQMRIFGSYLAPFEAMIPKQGRRRDRCSGTE
jgi:hypothetical protein